MVGGPRQSVRVEELCLDNATLGAVDRVFFEGHLAQVKLPDISAVPQRQVDVAVHADRELVFVVHEEAYDAFKSGAGVLSKCAFTGVQHHQVVACETAEQHFRR